MTLNVWVNACKNFDIQLENHMVYLSNMEPRMQQNLQETCSLKTVFLSLHHGHQFQLSEKPRGEMSGVGEVIRLM